MHADVHTHIQAYGQAYATHTVRSVNLNKEGQDKERGRKRTYELQKRTEVAQ